LTASYSDNADNISRPTTGLATELQNWAQGSALPKLAKALLVKRAHGWTARAVACLVNETKQKQKDQCTSQRSRLTSSAGDVLDE